MPLPEMQAFLSWFQAHGGYVDSAVMDVVDFAETEGGRGAIALVDIPKDHVVFSVPRSLVLSPRTSALPGRMGAAAWRKHGLHKGWAGLILCMMWEAARGAESKWCSYFEMMPTTFNTPMFWDEDELADLKGTSVVDKLGKEEAEKDYGDKILPAIRSRPDLFAQDDIPTRYSIDVFHIMGTRISSRSFTLSKEEEDEEDGEGKAKAKADQDGDDTITGSPMDVDEPQDEEETGEDNDEEEEEDESSEVAMVPLADILNARYKSENVRLFYEPDSLKMVSTKPIRSGDQIWNTYGDPPNAELLRGYGHVDYVPLPFAPEEWGNPGDVVELRADLVVQCTLDDLNARGLGVSAAAGGQMVLGMEDVEERIDWWLEEGGEDVFVLEHPSADQVEFTSDHPFSSSTTPPKPPPSPKTLLAEKLPPELLSFIRLIQLSPADFARARGKSKPPKGALDARALRVLCDVLRRRLAAYATPLEDDQLALFQFGSEMRSSNRRGWMALIVRVGEKMVLDVFGRNVEAALEVVESEESERREEERKRAREPAGSRAGKRKASREDESRRKISKSYY